jgi:hypothetical protein
MLDLKGPRRRWGQQHDAIEGTRTYIGERDTVGFREDSLNSSLGQDGPLPLAANDFASEHARSISDDHMSDDAMFVGHARPDCRATQGQVGRVNGDSDGSTQVVSQRTQPATDTEGLHPEGVADSEAEVTSHPVKQKHKRIRYRISCSEWPWAQHNTSGEDQASGDHQSSGEDQSSAADQACDEEPPKKVLVIAQSMQGA